jgi:cobalt-zinc-cadmium resistance protein CzcA
VPCPAPAGAGRVRGVSSGSATRRSRRSTSKPIPDPAPPIIELIAQWPGQSPEEVERYVTIPIEIAVSSTPGLKYLRSNTVYALGFIRLQFEYGRDYHFVRQQTLNRLKDATLPTA